MTRAAVVASLLVGTWAWVWAATWVVETWSPLRIAAASVVYVAWTVLVAQVVFAHSDDGDE